MLMFVMAAAMLTDAVDPALTDFDLRALETMSATAMAGGVAVHFDPSTVRPADAELEAARAREALVLVEGRLETRLEATAHLFLYRDREQFRVRTGAPMHWGGFAGGRRSIHAPRGAPLLHEFTHLVAQRFPGCEGRDPGGLLREGLAAALEGEDRGAPVASWAAVYRRLGLLPSLASLREAWTEEPLDGVHGYNVAGAFVGWILEKQGAAKLKALYAEPDRAAEILGREWDALEREWHADLDARRVSATEEDLVRRRMGIPADRLPEALASAEEDVRFDGTGLAGWAPRSAGVWTLRDGLLRATAADEWEFLDTDPSWKSAVSLRATVRLVEGGSLLLRVNRREGSSDEALLTGEGSFLGVKGGKEGFARSPVRLVAGRWTDVVLAQDRGTARLYLEGRLVLEEKGAFGPGGGGASIGVSGGSIEIRAAAVLLPPAR